MTIFWQIPWSTKRRTEARMTSLNIKKNKYNISPNQDYGA